MNTKILLIGLGVAALTSCTTAYKSGQTPDDVYFSPAKEREEYVDVESRQDRYYPQQNAGNYDYNTYRDDRFLRMRIANRSRWSGYNDLYLNDYDYGRIGYTGIGYDYNLTNPWNSYFYWNNFYNPYTRYSYTNPGYYGYYNYNPGYYHGGGIIGVPLQPAVVSRPRSFNPASYTNRNYSNSQVYVDGKLGTTRPTFNNSNTQYNNSNSSARINSSSNGRYNNSNRSSSVNTNGSAVGNAMRRVFDNSGNNNNSYQSNNNSRNDTYTPPQSRSSEAPVRTYTPSSSSSSSSSGSSGGSSRPSRF